ncbi:hypothetical protein GR212_27770 [Rhizobium lusitanum]|uniref:Uncharacterized protein n=1 Tax=Rhizobium lusitanum TaxID=293958 RepID=A0A6L9UFK2_9HYPH|nr:hypothetical protein [Rhizobium lusitanum]NEI73358.1 hypothetical protein [Rhizobium lusitanum]
MPNDVSVYVFSSKSITNIWAGYGAETWAVAIGSETTNKGKTTKAGKMPLGSFGILYCEPWKAFTVPFVTCSVPKQNETEEEIWADKWMLPFRFKPLGNPRNRIGGSEVLALPGARARNIGNYANYLTVQGNFAFQASTIDAQDWETIISRLI